MKKILFILLFILLINPVFAKHLHSEATYQKAWSDKHNGIIEYELPDKARVDIMATIDGIDYAIEVDFSRGSKIYECIGQSLYYALSTNRKAGALLIIEEPKDYFYFERFKKVADKYGIRYWIITPEGLKTESQTNEL